MSSLTEAERAAFLQLGGSTMSVIGLVHYELLTHYKLVCVVVVGELLRSQRRALAAVRALGWEVCSYREVRLCHGEWHVD